MEAVAYECFARVARQRRLLSVSRLVAPSAMRKPESITSVALLDPVLGSSLDVVVVVGATDGVTMATVELAEVPTALLAVTLTL